MTTTDPALRAALQEHADRNEPPCTSCIAAAGAAPSICSAHRVRQDGCPFCYPAAEAAPLDVERLARALRVVFLFDAETGTPPPDETLLGFAVDVAREYAALAATSREAFDDPTRRMSPDLLVRVEEPRQVAFGHTESCWQATWTDTGHSRCQCGCHRMKDAATSREAGS